MGNDDIRDDWPIDRSQHTFETEYTDRPPSSAIVETIAAIEGTRPMDVDFSLYESVDPDALDTIFADSNDDDETADDIVAQFRINGYLVQIRTNGEITVKDLHQSE